MFHYEQRANSDIRRMLQESKVPQYEIARRCHIDEGTLCRWLRYELSEDDARRKMIINAIKEGSC